MCFVIVMDPYLPAVHRALAFIEENLKEPLTLEHISRRAGFSLWHFQRIFTAYVGEPLGTYLRRRRITSAFDDLVKTKSSVLSIALDYQFETHAAFTRAFVAVLGVTPSEARRTRRHPRFQAREPITLARMNHLVTIVTMNPKTVTLPALNLIGIEGRFIGPMSPDANNHLVIPKLFGEFAARQRELSPALDKFTYGACGCLPEGKRSREDELAYLVSANVADGSPVPPGMSRWSVPSATYAFFTHRGKVTTIEETLNYIYGTWFPRSDYDAADGLSIERYDERFGDGGDKSELDILIPIIPRAAK